MKKSEILVKELNLIIQNLVIFLYTSVDTTEQCPYWGSKCLICPYMSQMELFWNTNEAFLPYCNIWLKPDFRHVEKLKTVMFEQ